MTVSEYNQCVDKHADGLYRFLLKSIKDSEKARDLVQDTFEKLWLKAPEVNFEKAKSYIFSTGYHTMIDMVRRDKKQGDFGEVQLNSLADTNQYSDLNEILHQALEQLPQMQRSLILLRDYEGYSYQEIAELCNISETQVKVYIFRGRKALQQYIGNMEVLL